MTRARGWAWRAMLSVLAGSGLTAAGLGGPLAGGALAADTPVSPASSGEGSTAPVTTTPAPSTPAAGSTEAAGAPANTSATTTPSSSTAQPTTTQPTASQPATTPAAAPAVVEAPTVVVQRRQKTTPSKNTSRNPTVTATHAQPSSGQPASSGAQGPTKASGPNGVAPSPQVVAAQAGALAAELATSAASVQALGFYRIPLFLLPIYQAAAAQYGVPWQILAAINEVETDYGSDLSVSSAGAEGWMQFEPSTWLQYGVDALDAGYADPYNPVDAIFAAARYLHAAGAAKDLHTAILAYNHSEAYAESVLLRAKLISSYPKAVIATLTGLVDARLPVTGKQVSWGALLPSASSATANSKAVAGAAKTGSSAPAAGSQAPAGGSSAAATGSQAAASSAAQAGESGSSASGSTPGSVPAPSPTAAAAGAGSGAETTNAAPRFVELLSAPNASVVAVQDGRVLELGSSHRLGKYVVLRDIYGDVFTYAGLGSIAPRYRLPKVPSGALLAAAKSPAAGAGADTSASAGTSAGATGGPASAGGDSPVTLQVKQSRPQSVPSQDSVAAGSAESVPAVTGKVRLFANPGNPDALAAAARVTTTAPAKGSGRGLPLRRGSLVAEGTVLGHVLVPHAAKDGHLRFAVQPAGDSGSIDPGPVLANWKELDAALYPQGAKGQSALLGATASDVFLLAKSQLELAVLSDPGIVLDARARHEISSGAIDRRVLAVLAFLSRSGLKPTVAALYRGPSRGAAARAAAADTGGAVDISAVNGIPIAGHEGSGSIADSTIRTLLTLQGEFAPNRIASLMRYPDAASTFATRAHANAIQIDFQPSAAALAPTRAAGAKAARAAAAGRTAAAGKTAPSPFVASPTLTLTQWNELLARIGAIPAPKVAAKPTSAAIRDPQAAPSNRGLGAGSPASGG